MSLYAFICQQPGKILETLVTVELSGGDLFHATELIKAAYPQSRALQYLGTFEGQAGVAHQRHNVSAPPPEEKKKPAAAVATEERAKEGRG